MYPNCCPGVTSTGGEWRSIFAHQVIEQVGTESGYNGGGGSDGAQGTKERNIKGLKGITDTRDLDEA